MSDTYARDSSKPGLREWLILATVQLTTLLFGMSITIANVVLPQMKGALSATQDQIAWVVTFNLVAMAIGTPITGWLASRLGWRNLMLISVGGFTVATAFCGMATSLEALILFRVAQGLFGAPIFPLGQGMLLASFPRHMHALVLMMWGVGGVVGPVVGPIFGGMIAEALDWRWAFFMIVPFGVLGLLGAWISLGNQEREPGRRLDFTGFLALAVAIGATQLMLDRGQRLDWFDSTEIMLEAAIAIIAFYLFVVHTLTATRPFLNPRLFLDRNFTLGLMLVFTMGMLSYTPMVLFPPLLQELRGYPDSVVGFLLAARGCGNWLSFLIVVQFTRYDARLCLAVGLAMQALAGLAMAQLDINLSSFDVFWTNVLQGFGFGLAYTPMAVLAFVTLDVRLMTEGASVFNLIRHFGSSIFISLSIMVLVRSTAQNYAGMTEWISPFNELFSYPSLSGLWSTETTTGLAALSGEIKRQSTMIGYINAFYLFAGAAAIAIPLSWLFRQPPKATAE